MSTTTNLKQVYTSALQLMTPLNIKQLYKVSVLEAQNLVLAQCGSIFIKQKTSFQRVFTNVPLELQIQPRKRGNLYRSLKEKKILLIKRKELLKIHPEIPPKIKAMVLVPLVFSNKSVGVMNLMLLNKDRISIDQKQSLTLFASLISLAIRNLQLFEEYQQAISTRDFMISIVSHELKTPLTTIFAYAQLIGRKTEKEETLPPNWAVSLLSNTKRLQRLIDDLFTVNQIATGTFNYSMQPIDILDPITEVVEQFQLVHPHRLELENVISNTHHRIIMGDATKLSLVIHNVLNNAVKYSPEDSKIVLNLVTDAKQEKVFIKVIDKGMGIAPDELKQIFKQFYQGSNHKNGLGLGLYISKEIIHTHQGQITIKSQVAKGTVVTIALPIQEQTPSI